MKPLQRHLAAWSAAMFVVAAMTAVWASPLAAESSRKTMGATRKTMGSERSQMKSTRRTGTSELRRGGQSSSSSTRGGYTSTTRRESELKKDASRTPPSTTPGSDSTYRSPGGGDWNDPYAPFDDVDADEDWNRADDGRENRREERRREQVHERTLGRSCILGAGGRVVYRPAGAVCAGDAAPPTAASPRTAAEALDVPAAGPRSGRSPTPSQGQSGCGGRCMYGPEGRVLYAPAGCDC